MLAGNVPCVPSSLAQQEAFVASFKPAVSGSCYSCTRVLAHHRPKFKRVRHSGRRAQRPTLNLCHLAWCWPFACYCVYVCLCLCPCLLLRTMSRHSLSQCSGGCSGPSLKNMKGSHRKGCPCRASAGFPHVNPLNALVQGLDCKEPMLWHEQ